MLCFFFDGLKPNHCNLSCTMESSQSSLTFLDIQIYIDSQCLIAPTLYRKPSADNSLVHATSSHPGPLVASVPYGQYLRLRRNCSENSHFETEAKALQNRLLSRCYSRKCLKKAYLKAKYRERSFVIHSPRKVKPVEGVRLITRFSGQHRQMRDLLQQHLYLLTGDPLVSKHLKQHPEITF